MGVLVQRLRFLGIFRNKAAAWDEKDKGENQSAYDVILNRSALIGPNKNAFGYSPDY